MCDTLQEAHALIRAQGATFSKFSYIGGFPVYFKDSHNPTPIAGEDYKEEFWSLSLSASLRRPNRGHEHY